MKRTATLLAALAVAFATTAATVRTATENFVAFKIDEATTNLDARPVPITPQTSGRGVTFVDQYGEDQNVAVAIGAGAQAAVTTNAVEAADNNKVIRSTGVAIGGHATVENSADPLKIQGVAVGWHATVSAINGVAVGGGANHPGDDNATTASAPKAIAIGYNAKASAANAVQLGEGVNTEEDTLKFRNVTIVKDGKIQGSIDEDQLLADGFTKMDFSESNTVKRVTIRNDEHTFRVVTDTNRADGVALTMGDAEIYGTAAIDRALIGKADVDYVWRNFANLQIIAWPYSSANTYNKGDYCIHDYGTTVNALCRCKVDNTTGYWYSENWGIVRLADQTVLKSIHSETPEFGAWTISQNPNYGVPIYGLYYAPIGSEYEEAGLPSADTEVWWFDMTGTQEGIWTTETNSAATSVSCVMPLAFPDHTENITLTGTRTITYPVIAYQLGSNSDKLLQPKGDYALLSEVYAAVQQIAPEFDATRTAQTKYKQYELVSKDGVVYQCANTNGHYGAWNASNWTTKKVSELFLPLTGGAMTGPIAFANNIFEPQSLPEMSLLYSNDSWTFVGHMGNDIIRTQPYASGVIALLSDIAVKSVELNGTALTPDANGAVNVQALGSSGAQTLNGSLSAIGSGGFVELLNSQSTEVGMRCWNGDNHAVKYLHDGIYVSTNGAQSYVKLSLPSVDASLAPLASPAFTGTPTAPTPASGDNSTKVATTAFVQAAISGISVTPLSGQTFNFATTQGVMDALKTVIETLGGTVTNAPSTTISQGE